MFTVPVILQTVISVTYILEQQMITLLALLKIFHKLTDKKIWFGFSDDSVGIDNTVAAECSNLGGSIT